VVLKPHRPKRHRQVNSYSHSLIPRVESELDFSSYQPLTPRDSTFANPERLFHGIIRYIYINSNRMYNNNEILLEYRDLAPNSDPANIFDFQSSDLFQSGVGPDQFLKVTFRRILVRPCAYAIRAGPQIRRSPHLISFIFQGFDRARSRWVTLDERHNIFEIVPGFAARICYIDTDQFFSQFRIMQTHTSNLGSPEFAISGFEIHGTVKSTMVKPSTFDPVSDDEFDGDVAE
jgi:hypothetical protein